ARCRPQRAPRRDAPSRGPRQERRGRRRRGARSRDEGAEAHRRPRPPDRRASQAQRSRDHGGLAFSLREKARSPPVNILSRIRTLARVRSLPEQDLPEVAETVAIIMDGNGRWARRRGLPNAAGHRAGTRALRLTVEAGIELGIRHIVVYAFSTEIWSRPQDEVDALMEIFAETMERELPDLAETGVRARS